ncbi:MAG: family 43 glycosylhydrolase, partial [Micromonosporaceae bacterium]
MRIRDTWTSTRTGRRLMWLGLTSALLLVTTIALVPPAGSAAAADGPIPLTGPDTIIKPGPNDRYITYGASAGTGRFVPYVVHGSGNTVGMDTTIDGDAMPGGPGAWARSDIGLWAPSVVSYGGAFYLFYTATMAGTGDPGRKCIGVARSAAADGPFNARPNPLLCDAGGWSIDAEAFVGPNNGYLYVTYRDDAVETDRETAISVVRLNNDATEVLEKRVQLTSRAVTWENAEADDGSHIIENPSMIRAGGTWWLFYS